MLIDLATFDEAKAITLRAAANSGRLSQKGRRPSIQMVQRWANRKRGFKPVGLNGPTIYLATVKTARELLTMPEWVDAFVSESQRIRIEWTRRLVTA